MVSGDICAPPPPDPEPEPTEACEFDDNRSNGLLAFWLTPVDGADDDFDDVSALRASRADDAAPKARNMANSNNAAPVAADGSCIFLSKRRAMMKNPIKPGSAASAPIRQARQ